MINLICRDLRKEEVFIQIADCLEYLERITSESFDKINEKLSQFNNELVKIEKRREIVKTKIKQIKKNNNKAIQVFSPFYYPAKNIKDQYKYESLIKINKLKSESNEYLINQPFELFHPDDLNDMLNFSDLEQFLRTEKENFNFLQRQKLNKSTIPWNRIKSISSLLVFNSSETAYIKSDQDSSIYEFKAANKQKKNEEDNELNFGNMAPPKSMTIKKEKISSFDQNLFKYDELEAPKVLDNLPNDLPDLDAVADNIFFNDKASSNLPKIANELIHEDKETDNQQLPSKLFHILSFNQSSVKSIEESKETSKNLDDSRFLNKDFKIIPHEEIIPVPPPLPISLESSSEIAEKSLIPLNTAKKMPQQSIMTDDSRANLLDSIRKAAGRPDKSKVKTIKEKKLEERKNRKEAVSTDLMSDLKKHLVSRRQAMVGTKFNQQNNKAINQKDDDGNVYNTLKFSKMIPSPSGSPESSENESDDDWVNS